MRKQMEESAAAEGARRATGAARRPRPRRAAAGLGDLGLRDEIVEVVGGARPVEPSQAELEDRQRRSVERRLTAARLVRDGLARVAQSRVPVFVPVLRVQNGRLGDSQ